MLKPVPLILTFCIADLGGKKSPKAAEEWLTLETRRLHGKKKVIKILSQSMLCGH